jgi:hypothetical protein
MSIRNLVLNSIKEGKILIEKKEYRFLIDQKGGRLDLPYDLTPTDIEPGQHRENLFYADCVLLDESKKPRMLIEVVSSNPQDPNGIVGLVINLDRLARFPRGDYSGVDLLFIVLGQIKRYWCSLCKRGHHMSRDSQHFSEAWEAVKNNSPAEILHEGMAMNYRKALLDYPIAPYLRTIRTPSVLFLNSERIMNDWRTYQPTVLSLVKTHISERIRDPDRNTNPVFVGVEQLFPETIAKMLGIA